MFLMPAVLAMYVFPNASFTKYEQLLVESTQGIVGILSSFESASTLILKKSLSLFSCLLTYNGDCHDCS